MLIVVELFVYFDFDSIYFQFFCCVQEVDFFVGIFVVIFLSIKKLRSVIKMFVQEIVKFYEYVSFFVIIVFVFVFGRFIFLVYLDILFAISIKRVIYGIFYLR